MIDHCMGPFPDPPFERTAFLNPLRTTKALEAEAAITGVEFDDYWISCIRSGVAYFYAWLDDPRATVLVVFETPAAGLAPKSLHPAFIEVRTCGDKLVGEDQYKVIAAAVLEAFASAWHLLWMR